MAISIDKYVGINSASSGAGSGDSVPAGSSDIQLFRDPASGRYFTPSEYVGTVEKRADGKYYADGAEANVVTYQTSVTGVVTFSVEGVSIPAGVSGRSALQALSLASTRRVDLVMIGDSNQLFGGYGFTGGFENALASRFGAYATGLFPARGVQGSAITGNTDSSSLVGTGAPAGFQSEVFSAQNGLVSGYGYFPAGALPAAVGGVGAAQHAGFRIADKLRAWFAMATSTSFSGGSLNAAGLRIAYAPYSTIANAPAISTGTEDRIAYYKCDAIADAARVGPGVEARWQIPGGVSSTGPVQILFTRIERPDCTSGVSVHTLGYYAGQSSWMMSKALDTVPDETLRTYFSEVRRLQIASGLSPVVVVYINEGLNDRNNTYTPSRGPGRVVGTGDSASEYVDNIRAIQQRIKSIWRTYGWDVSELYWLIVPSHRIADPDDGDLLSYRAAAKSSLGSEPQTSVIDLGSMMTQAEGTAGGWYATGQNFVHLTKAGYDAIAAKVVALIP